MVSNNITNYNRYMVSHNILTNYNRYKVSHNIPTSANRYRVSHNILTIITDTGTGCPTILPITTDTLCPTIFLPIITDTGCPTIFLQIITVTKIGPVISISKPLSFSYVIIRVGWEQFLSLRNQRGLNPTLKGVLILPMPGGWVSDTIPPWKWRKHRFLAHCYYY